MSWSVEYLQAAADDLDKLDRSQQIRVLKAIKKVAKNPLPNYEGGYGKPLGNQSTSKLTGYCKIKLRKLGIRVVYGIVKEDHVMKVIVISVRADDLVYKLAEKRIES